MSQRRKTLSQLVDGGTFLARRHADRLLEAPLERADLRELQGRYYAAGDTDERRMIARLFETAVRNPPENRARLSRAERAQRDLDKILRMRPRRYEP